MRHTLTILVITSLFPAAAQAQTAATKTPVPHQQVISTNPFGLLFKWYNVEYERKIGEATALDGFYLGARAGAYRTKTHTYEYSTQPPRLDPNSPTPTHQTYPTNPTNQTYRERTTVAPGLGLEMGYNWLLGPERNFSVGLGFGVTRMLRSGNSGDDFIAPAVSNVRLVNIGIAF